MMRTRCGAEVGVDVAHGHRLLERSPRRSSEGEVDVCGKARRKRGPGMGDLRRARTWGLCSVKDNLIREVAHGVVSVVGVGDIDDWDGDGNSCADEVGEGVAQDDGDGEDVSSNVREPRRRRTQSIVDDVALGSVPLESGERPLLRRRCCRDRGWKPWLCAFWSVSS